MVWWELCRGKDRREEGERETETCKNLHLLSWNGFWRTTVIAAGGKLIFINTQLPVLNLFLIQALPGF
jgi:hypothetical protein